MSTRVVTARQGGRTLGTTVASFHAPPSGDARPSIEHEWPTAQGDPPDPDTLPSRWASLSDRYGDDLPGGVGARWPVDLRYIDHVPWNDAIAPARNRLWVKTIRYPREMAAADAAALAFATDLPMFEPVYFPTGMPWRDMVGHTAFLGATLSHAVWLHRPARLDEWLLLEQVAPVAHDYRAFCRAELRSRSGNSWQALPRRWCSSHPRPVKRRDGPT